MEQRDFVGLAERGRRAEEENLGLRIRERASRSKTTRGKTKGPSQKGVGKDENALCPAAWPFMDGLRKGSFDC